MLSVVVAWCHHNRVFVWRNNTGGFKHPVTGKYIRFGFPGSPDLLGMTRSGRFLGIECKREGGRLEDSQKRFKEQCEASGGIYLVIRSIDDLEAHREAILRG
ncbi:VRR-NUC domain-containing protein [Gemmata sp. G18]|uniref:VRR-NUC domain-containing protein n=1 Tax=Gemmata palustris TaxID=2822762 RepID=A0ABS5BXH7_9BACT|nr:VRR-NUC domain-containing protein [Gemmata palustris]MBP3958368.1 VRR-NUC domain-containing protein [Gemmata palustris]